MLEVFFFYLRLFPLQFSPSKITALQKEGICQRWHSENDLNLPKLMEMLTFDAVLWRLWGEPLVLLIFSVHGACSDDLSLLSALHLWTIRLLLLCISLDLSWVSCTVNLHWNSQEKANLVLSVQFDETS